MLMLLLRVVYLPVESAQKLDNVKNRPWLDTQFVDKAKNHLQNQPGWAQYLNAVSSSYRENRVAHFKNLGMFSLVRYYQIMSLENLSKTIRMVPKVEKADLLGMYQNVRAASEKPVKKKKHGVSRSGSHLSKGNIDRTASVPVETL